MKKYLTLVSGILTIIVVFIVVNLLTSDFATSITPGWHTTIYPREFQVVFITIFILVAVFFTNGIYMVLKNLLKRISKS